MRSIKVLAAIFSLSIWFCGQPVLAEPAPLTWIQLETEEKVTEVMLPEPAENRSKSISAKGTEKRENNLDISTAITKNSDYLATAIEEMMKRRQEDDKLLAILLSKQKEQEEIKKQEEELKKRQEQAQKEEEQQKLIENFNQSLQKQKEEENQKFASILTALKEQQAEQNNNVLSLINAFKEEQAKREQKETEQQALLGEAIASALKPNSFSPITPTPEIKITPVKTLQESIADSIQDASNAAYRESDTTFFYSPGAIYKIYCREGFVTDIELQPGEEIQYIGGGDTVRWVIDQAQSGYGQNKTWHIYLKPLKTGLETNIIINTDKHNYQLHVQSAEWYTPIIKWTYPQEEKAAFYRAQSTAQRLEEENLGKVSFESLNFNYEIKKGKSYIWTPVRVFDDGTKTYLKMPESMSTNNAPVLFVKDGKNLAMVNYRLKNGMFVVDRLFKEAELRNGNEIVRIKKK